MSQIGEFIEGLIAVDRQLEKVLINRLKYQPQFKYKLDATFVISSNFTCLFVSFIAAELFGLHPANMVNRNWRELAANWSVESRQQFEEQLREICNTGGAANCEVAFPDANGRHHYAECSFSPIFSSQGDIEAILCNFTDITGRKLSEIALVNQSEKFKQLSDLCPMAICTVDTHGQITASNKALLEEMSLTEEELVGKSYRLVTDRLGVGYEESVLLKALQGIETRHDVFFSLENKKYIRNAVPVREQPTGSIVGAIGILSNITKHEKFREEIHKKQQVLLSRYLDENRKLNQIIEVCPFGIALFDERGNVSAMNQAFFERLIPDFRKVDFIGNSGKNLTRGLGWDWESSLSLKALNGQGTLNYCLKEPDRTYLINSIPLRNYENVITGAITIIQNITEYEKFREEMARLDRLSLVGEMAAGVAHEIRNPMTVIKGYLQFLSGKVSDSMIEQFSIALDELERVEQIISDFLSLAGNKLTEYKELDLNGIIKRVIPLIQTDAVKLDIELELKLAEGIPCLLLNGNEIKQLLLNLARNGMEAMNQHGKLTIETGFEADTVRLCISDCGVGISKECQAKMFDPFYTTKTNGTGLGLAVCAGIVRRHNGTIEVQSEEGKGTRIIITFKKSAQTA